MTSTTNFIGIPVHGDITHGDKRARQRPIEELQPLLQAVLDDEQVAEFGWQQYTPYFNDGDPCVFNVYGFWLRTQADDEDADRYDLEVNSSHPSLGTEEWDENKGTYVARAGAEPGSRERYERCRALSDAIEGGEFDDVLLEAFGDHAQVKVRRAGIEVEFYSHD